MKKYVNLSPFLIVAAMTLNVFAADEHLININQGVPYKVLYNGDLSDQENKSGLGVTVRNDQGGWDEAQSGHVLVDIRKGPFWHALTVGNTTENYESATVVNGRLRVINILSKEDIEGSFIELGTDKHLIVDPISRNNLRLPLINKASDISINSIKYPETGRRGPGEFVIVSMRTGDSNLTGDGITFSFYMTTNQDGEMQLEAPPVLLDYNFHQKSDLEGLVRRSTTGGRNVKVLSKNLLNAFSQPQVFDHPALKDWKEGILADIDVFMSGSADPELYLNHVGEVVMPSEISSTNLKNETISVAEIYSFSGKSEVEIKSSSGSFVVPGKLDRDSAGNVIHKWTADESLIVSVDGTKYLVPRANKEVIRLGDLQFPENGNVSFYFHDMKEDGFRIIMSWDNSDSSQETILLFSELDHNNTFVVKNRVFLSGHYFDSDDIEERVNSDTTKNVTTFDPYTKPSRTRQEYNTNKNDFGPLVDLSSGEVVYKKPIEEQKIGMTDEVKFIRYDDVSNPNLGLDRKTGLYLKGRDDGILGDMIDHPATQEPQWDTQVIQIIPERDPHAVGFKDSFAYQASIFVMDPSFGSNEKAHTHIVVSTVQGESNAKGPLGGHTPLSIFDLENLKHGFVRILPGLKERQIFTVLYRVDSEKGDGVLQALQYEVKKIGPKKDGAQSELQVNMVGTPTKLSGENLEEGDILDRIKYDSEGNMYFVKTPLMEHTDESWRAINLLTNDTVNGKQIRTPKLISYYEVADGVSPQSFRKTKAAEWRVYKNHLNSSATIDAIIKDGDNSDSGGETLFAAEYDRIQQMVSGNPDRVMLVVPDQYKDQVYNLILSKWMNGEKGEIWSMRNEDLELFVFGDEMPERQVELREYLRSIPKEIKPSQVPFLMVDAAKVIEAGRLGGIRGDRLSRIPDYNLADDSEYIEPTTKEKKSSDEIIVNIPEGFDAKALSEAMSGKMPENTSNYKPTYDFRDLLNMHEDGQYVEFNSDGTVYLDGQEVIVNFSSEEDEEEFLDLTSNSHQEVDDKVAAVEEDVEDEGSDAENPTLPHALKWLVTGGQKVDYPKLKDLGDPKFPMLMVVSESELNQLKTQDAEVEDSFGIFDLFSEQKIIDPDYETQKAWVQEIFDSPEVRRMDYTFDASMLHRRGSELAEDQAQEHIVEHIISRVNELSEKENRNLLVSMGNTLASLRSQLIQNPRIRARRVIDASVIQQVLARDFAVTLQPEYMPEDDRLAILAQENFMQLVFQKTGYNNFKDVGTIRELILQQSTGETSLAVGSSFILAGDPGVGKTDLILSMAKTLGLKEYDYKVGNKADPKNNDAEFFFIRGSEMENSNAPGFITADDIIKHLNHFLTLPNGYRGWIVIDDVHQIRPEERQKLLQYIRSIQDLKPGQKVKAVSTFDDDKHLVRHFSPGNLVIGVTTNLTTDTKKISDAQKSKTGEPTIADMLVATLSDSKHVTFDHSSVDRFGMAMYTGNPPWAKETKFISNLVEQSSIRFDRGEYFFTSPLVVSGVVDKFQSSMNGREFGQKAPNAIANHFSENRNPENGAYVIVPQMGLGSTKDKDKVDFDSKSSTKNTREINDYVEEESLVLPLKTNREAQMYFLDGVVDSFRVRLFEDFANAAERLEAFAGTQKLQERNLSWIQQALYDHLQERPRISLSALKIDPKNLGAVDPYSRELLREEIERFSLQGDYFPPIFGKMPAGLRERRVFEISDETETPRTRGLVNTEYASKVFEDVEKMISASLGVDNLSQLPQGLSLDDWTKRLEDRNEKDLMELKSQVGDALANSLVDYMNSMSSDEVINYHISQNSGEDGPGVLSFYDMARTYLHVLDKAIAKLPWGGILGFLVENIENLTDEISLKGRPGVQNILFNDKHSILRPVSQSHLIQILDQAKPRQSLNKDRVESSRDRYPSQCELILSEGGF